MQKRHKTSYKKQNNKHKNCYHFT